MYEPGKKYDGYAMPDVTRNEEFVDRLQQISRLQPGGRLLDIGCSRGEFLELVSETGRYEFDGVDISAEAARLASARLKRNIFCGTIENLSSAPGSYDVVTAWEVIEHMHDPGTFLRDIWRLLKPGGLLCLSTPNTDKVRNRIPGKPSDLFFIPPEHLFYFNRNNLRLLVAHAGFRPLMTDVSSKRFLRWFTRDRSVLRRMARAALGVMSGIGLEGYNIVVYGRKDPGGT